MAKIDYSKMTNSRFVLSFDFELGWGCLERSLWVERQKKSVYDQLREVLPKFLEELRALELNASWAVVGAMIDEPRSRDFSYLPDSVRNSVIQFCEHSESKTNDGRDLFDLLLSSSQKDIVSHSLSLIHI